MLREYQKKRDFAKTSEPRGRKYASGQKRSEAKHQTGLSFVVQKHAARRLHYDFRLELDGVLLSWAVPKGVPLEPSEKRMAVRTEDHPLEYRNFEGVVPAPGYGAGEVIIWDRGTYSPIEDGKPSGKNRPAAEALVRKGLEEGKLSFFLQGEKLKGAWSLVRLKGKENDWLLIKHNDPFANRSLDSSTADRSVVTSRTLEDIEQGREAPAGSPRNERSKPAGVKRKFPDFEPPMLATLVDAPFSKTGWFFEPKLDGIRGLAYLKKSNVDLYSRRGLLLTKQYPALVSELASYNRELVMDGEIVALDSRGRPSFQVLQGRSGLTRAQDIKAADEKISVVYYVFDLLYCDGRDLRAIPLYERKDLLKEAIGSSKRIKLVEDLGQDGEAAFKVCLDNGLEGVVGKEAASQYESGRRSRSWLKVKATLSSEFLICGYTRGLGARHEAFGALILGEHDSAGKLVYVGAVGTGFDAQKLRKLLSLMRPLVTSKCPLKERPPGKVQATWLIPKLVAEIKYAERTKDNILRAPVFMHLREDVPPEQVKPAPIIHVNPASLKKPMNHNNAMQSEVKEILSALDGNGDHIELRVGGSRIELSNLNKVFWPACEGRPAITKRGYIKYLAEISPYVLPHLRDRLITLVRFPNGIAGGKFYQKHWEDNLPNFVNTVRAYTEHEGKDQDFLLCNNLPTLIWLGQIADLELHTSHTRITKGPDARTLPTTFTGSLERIENSLLNYPDYMVFDLDPYLYSGKEGKGQEPELNQKGFNKTCQVALWLKELLDELSLSAFVKTSGRTGLHIYAPIVRDIDYDTVRRLSESVGRSLLSAHPEEVTMEWRVAKRTGKVFFDHNMNARSKSLASIYSPRVASAASVSTAVAWHELEQIYPTDFTIETVPGRLASSGDLWSEILSYKNDLRKVLTGASAIRQVKRPKKNSAGKR